MMTDNEFNAKILIAVGIFVVGFFGASAPLKIRKVDENWFSVGNLMASGILLAAGIVHQLPDGMEKFESSSWSNFFPVAPFITGLTFCLFLLLEEFVHMYFEGHPLISNHSHGMKETCAHDENSNHLDKTEIDPLIIYQSNDKTHETHEGSEHETENFHGSLLASVILLFALTIHSIFEGLAIGISSNTNEVISTTVPVLAHKGFAGYALGSSMVASGMNESHYFVLAIIFSSSSAIGLIWGMMLKQRATLEDPAVADIRDGLIKTIVAGTFLYISIFEIGLKDLMVCRDAKSLTSKFEQNQMQWRKLAAFFLGYLAMSSLAAFI